MIRTLFAKVIDRVLKKTGLYRVSFSDKNNVSSSQIQRGFVVCPINIEDVFFKAIKNNNYFIFTKKENIEVFKKQSQTDNPFWKVNWKGFDPKNYWEIARGWQWLPAYLGANTKEEEKLVLDTVLNWLDKNPFPNGLAWAVNLDVAIRAINLLLIYQVCHDERFMKPLLQHYKYIKKRIWLSQMSMQNNHYLGELTALAILAKLFDLKEKKQYRSLLENEFKNQFYPDGVNVEQSMRYHAFSIQFALLAKIFLNLELPFLEKAMDFVLMMRKPDGTWPSFGDDDMGCVFRLNSDPMTDDYNALTGFSGLLYSDQESKYVIDTLPPEPQLFLEDAQAKWNRLKKKEPELSKIFPDGGFWAKRTGWEKDANWLMVKFGPHKWHAHADLFHIELSIGGKPVLVDSGTYRYNNVPDKRKYFRSTAAHNCLEFDGRDQSKQLTTFRWGKCAKVTNWDISENEQGFTFFGSHNGYAGKGLVHLREIDGQKNLNELIIRDTLEGNGEGEAIAYWHFHPDIQLEEKGKAFEINLGNKHSGLLEFDSNDRAKAEIIETPFSERYGHFSKKKTIVIRSSKKPFQPLILKSHFTFNLTGENA